jgi:hypothetical protein
MDRIWLELNPCSRGSSIDRRWRGVGIDDSGRLRCYRRLLLLLLLLLTAIKLWGVKSRGRRRELGIGGRVGIPWIVAGVIISVLVGNRVVVLGGGNALLGTAVK